MQILFLFFLVFIAGCPNETTTYRAFLRPPAINYDEATGSFKMICLKDTCSWGIDIQKLSRITMAHIHGNMGNGLTPACISPFTGDKAVTSGTFNMPDDGNSCNWKTMDDFYQAIKEGKAFVNIHNFEHPSGAISGILK